MNIEYTVRFENKNIRKFGCLYYKSDKITEIHLIDTIANLNFCSSAFNLHKTFGHKIGAWVIMMLKCV